MSTDVKDLVARLREEMGSIGGPSYMQMMQQRLEAALRLEAQAEEIERLTTLCEETQMERRTLQYEVSMMRDRAEAAERERDAFRAENERLQVVIKDLELACEQLAAGRSDRAYHTMIEDGQSNALLRLDVARAAARAALHPTQGVGDAD